MLVFVVPLSHPHVLVIAAVLIGADRQDRGGRGVIQRSGAGHDKFRFPPLKRATLLVHFTGGTLASRDRFGIPST